MIGSSSVEDKDDIDGSSPNARAGVSRSTPRVCAAIVSMEDDPAFDAGTGSVLNASGRVEMDACLMRGDDLKAGAVAAIQDVRNPILVARKVMEETEHVLLVGVGAGEFAFAHGIGLHE